MQLKVSLLHGDLHSSPRDACELEWKKRDGRAFLAMRSSWTKSESFKTELWEEGADLFVYLFFWGRDVEQLK